MSTTRPPTRPGEADVPPRATAVIVKDVLAGTQTLIRKELELARLELAETASKMGQAAGAGGAAGVVGLYVLGFLGLAGGFGLGEVLPLWAAFLIVAGVFLLIMIGALLFARSRANAASLPPQKTTTRIKEDVAWAKRLTRR